MKNSVELELEHLPGTMKLELVLGLPRNETKKFAIFLSVFGNFENSNHRWLVIRIDCGKLLSPPVANRL
jgi:hypothetical protein